MSIQSDTIAVGRLVCVSDIAGSGRAQSAELRDLYDKHLEALRRGASSTQLEWQGAHIQPQGDGVQLSWPAGPRDVNFVAQFPREVASYLREINQFRGPEHQIRLRMALAAGTSEITVGGLDSAAAITARYLCDSEPARAARRWAVDYPVVLMVDRALYESVVAERRGGLRPDQFMALTFQDKNDVQRQAWITIPDAGPDTIRGLGERLEPWGAQPTVSRLSANTGPTTTPPRQPPAQAQRAPTPPPVTPMSVADRPPVDPQRRGRFSWPPPIWAALIAGIATVLAAVLPVLFVTLHNPGSPQTTSTGISSPQTSSQGPPQQALSGAELWAPWDTSTPAPLRAPDAQGGTTAIAFDPSPGGPLAIGGSDGVVREYDARGTKLLRTLAAPTGAGAVRALAFNSKDQALAVGSDDSVVRVYGTDGTDPIRRLSKPPGGGAINALLFNDVGDTLVVADQNGGVREYDGHGTALARTLTPGHSTGAINAVAYSPNGDTLSVGGADGVVWEYDGHGDALAKTLRRQPSGSAVTALAYNPSGDTLAVAGTDGQIRVYDGHGTRQVRTMNPAAGPVNALTFNHGGDTLVAAGDAGVIWQYSGHATDLVRTQPKPPGAGSVHALAFNPQGDLLVSGYQIN